MEPARKENGRGKKDDLTKKKGAVSSTPKRGKDGNNMTGW